MSNYTAIIPCAGRGTRMNMQSNQSKELLIDPITNKPLIEWHLDLCKQYDIEPVVVTRQEKRDLVDYCLDRNIKLQLVDIHGEWPYTVLASKNNWNAYNILLLPDSRFGSIKTFEHVLTDLSLSVKASIALSVQEDASKWCVVDKYYSIHEKPETSLTENKVFAMGVIGFNQCYGEQLFQSLGDRRYGPHRLENVSFQYLDWYRDITRTGVVESY